jgi:hypothetical protein
VKARLVAEPLEGHLFDRIDEFLAGIPGGD